MRPSAWFLSALLFAAYPVAYAETRTFRISPAEFGKPEPWEQVQTALQSQPVEVVLSDELYAIGETVTLENLGHPHHRLTIRGPARIEEASGKKNERIGLISLEGCQNVLIRDLHFSGAAESAYALAVRNSQNITIEQCRFTDMTGLYAAAISILGAKTDTVTVRDCTFRRIGSGGHAHMIYTAYGPQRVRVLDCHFTDCAGDFVRFRDRSDHGVVYGCTFESTGTYNAANPPMITVPLFNDDDPAAAKPTPRYEYFGTNFLIARNRFTYARAGRQDTRFAVLFHHGGFNPPGKTHLFSPELAALVASGPAAERRAALEKNTGIRLENVGILDNEFDHVQYVLGYRSEPGYGAQSTGWEGVIDLSNLITTTGGTPTQEAAAGYFKKP